MARKPKKRKYTKRSAFWNKTALTPSMIAQGVLANLKNQTFHIRRMMDNPKHCIRAFDRRGDAAKFGQPYVCATCGEWHARLRA